MADLIDRQKIKARFEPWLKVKGYSEGELNIIRAVLYEITIMPSAQPECDDTVSRKAEIDAIKRYIIGFDAIDVNFLDGLKTAIQIIEQLPHEYSNAQNTLQRVGSVECEDAVSRQAAINTLIRESQADGAYGYLDAKSINDALERMPSAQLYVPDTTFGNMISRQAAIDAVRSYYDECDEQEESIEERIERLPSADIDLSDFSDKLWQAAYERGKADAVRWIPCSERLPAKKTEVIYTLDNNYVSTGYMTDRDYNGDEMELHWEDMESGALIYPEAWMPLPEPYKDGEQDG